MAHIYIKEGFANQTKKALEGITGIDRLLCGEEKKRLNIDHERRRGDHCDFWER